MLGPTKKAAASPNEFASAMTAVAVERSDTGKNRSAISDTAPIATGPAMPANNKKMDGLGHTPRLRLSHRYICTTSAAVQSTSLKHRGQSSAISIQAQQGRLRISCCVASPYRSKCRSGQRRGLGQAQIQKSGWLDFHTETHYRKHSLNVIGPQLTRNWQSEEGAGGGNFNICPATQP